MAVSEDTKNLAELADVDPDSILDRLNESIARKMPSYRDLYLRWERLNWSVSELDFGRDVEDWQGLDQHHRDRLLWTLSQFYVAEQRVAATITPYVSAAPMLEQKVFLTTQCVDEARHAIFFDRFFEEVVAAGDGDLARRLRNSRQWVGPGFAPLFDEYLEEIAQSLRDDPGDVRRFAKAMAVYHIVVEGVLALTGQKFILAWARNSNLLPAFRAGFTAVARDESRHVAFGARTVRDLLAEDPSLIEPIHEGIQEAIQLGTQLYQPPNGDVTYTTAFGYALTDLFNYGSVQLEKKLRAIGMPAPNIEVSLPSIDTEWPPPGGGVVAVDLRQRATLMVASAMGRLAPDLAPGIGIMLLHFAFKPEVTRDVEATFLFELAGRGGGTYTVMVDRGRCEIEIGSTRAPDVVYRMDATCWVEMVTGKVTGDEAVLLGRLTIKGDAILSRKFNDFFAPVGEPAVKLAAARAVA